MRAIASEQDHGQAQHPTQGCRGKGTPSIRLFSLARTRSAAGHSERLLYPFGVIADRLESLGIALPEVSPPAGNYVGCVIVNDMVHVGGHGPINGSEILRGKVGADLTLEKGRQAARMTGLSILATLQEDLGSLDRIQRLVKVFGMVNVAPGFQQTPAVIDGCSNLFVEVFGDAGRHTRSAVGLAELPFGIAVEIELIAQIHT